MTAGKDRQKNKGEKMGLKHDTGKNPVQLVPAEMIEAVAKVLSFGAEKYGRNTWQTIEDPVFRYTGALMRHLLEIQKGSDIDPESGLPHIYHVATNAGFLTYFHDRGAK